MHKICLKDFFKSYWKQTRMSVVLTALFFLGLSGNLFAEQQYDVMNTRQAALPEYKIQPGDVLEITVYEEPDLSTKVRVSANGQIYFPLLGQISVANLSVYTVQDQITRDLEKDYLINPQVLIYIETFHERNVFVTGSVISPGSYPISADKSATVMEAITMAGGFTPSAAANKTKIIRMGLDGQEETVEVKAEDIIKKGDKNKDVAVQPNDVIFVPESFF